MKKIWTLLVAAITVLAVLTSGCGSSDMGEVMRALCDMDQPFYLRPDHGRRIWASPSPHSTTPSSYPYVKALKKKQKNSESMLKSSMRKTIPQNRPMIFLT